MKDVDWIDLAHKDRLVSTVNVVMKNRVASNTGNFLTS
jgi:hypothetical protein